MRSVRPERAYNGCACALCQTAFGFSTSLGSSGCKSGRCIIGEQEQWRPWFRRSKLYSLMAATLRPGLAINNFHPLDQSSLRLISTTFSLISIGMAVELSV